MLTQLAVFFNMCPAKGHKPDTKAVDHSHTAYSRHVRVKYILKIQLKRRR